MSLFGEFVVQFEHGHRSVEGESITGVVSLLQNEAVDRRAERRRPWNEKAGEIADELREFAAIPPEALAQLTHGEVDKRIRSVSPARQNDTVTGQQSHVTGSKMFRRAEIIG